MSDLSACTINKLSGQSVCVAVGHVTSYMNRLISFKFGVNTKQLQNCISCYTVR